MKPKKWTDVYPHGTKEGDEELKFFIALARNPKYQWRSTSAVAKEAGITKERTEEIINKYYKKGMVFQNPKNEDQWGYWERVPEMLPKIQKSISQKDQDDRIGKLNKCGKDACDSGSCSCDKVSDWSCWASKDTWPTLDNPYVPKSKSLKQVMDNPCENTGSAAAKYMQELRSQFHNKKPANWLVTSPEVASIFETSCAGFAPAPCETFGHSDEVAERWHSPTTDEDWCFPVRPQGKPANADLFICQNCGATTNQIVHGQQLAIPPLCDMCTMTEKEWDLDV